MDAARGRLAGEVLADFCAQPPISIVPSDPAAVEVRLLEFVQYDPLSRFFEARDGTLLVSGDNGVPLIRYHIADEGGALSYEEMLTFCANHGFDPLADLPDAARHAAAPRRPAILPARRQAPLHPKISRALSRRTP